MSVRINWWKYLGAIALVAAVTWWALRPVPLAVDLAVATEGPLAVSVAEPAETRVRDRFLVAAPVSGRLERITLLPGDSVRSGTRLARLAATPLDPRARRELSARLEAARDAERMAQATAAETRAALDQAVRERARIETLYRQNVVAAEARERAELAETTRRREAEAAEFRAQAAAHDTEQAVAALASIGSGFVSVNAPVAGRILRVFEPSERVVAQGTPLFEIGDPRSLEIVTQVLSTDAVHIAPGDTATVTGWGAADTLIAIVRVVEPSGFTKVSALGVEEQRVNVTAALAAPPEALGDRYRVDVAITVWRADRVLTLPRSALFHADNAWRVFVVSEGRAVERVVTVGRQSLERTQITSGVVAGDSVIVRPDERVVGGGRVVPRPLD